MDTKLIAKILPTKKDGKRTIGTGYPIAKDLVVTARHVVVFPERDKDKPIVIEWTDYSYSDDNVAEIVFDGGEECDLVILKCKLPSQVQISSSILARRFPIEHETWAGFGYPQIGKDEEAGTREKISILGKFHPPNATSHKITLTSESDALEKESWRGVSGASVFQGTVLYAVITSTPKNRGECFIAVSIPHLLKYNEKFREALKQPIEDAIKEQKQKFQNKIKSEIAKLLNNGLIPMQELANRLSSCNSSTSADIAKCLVEDNSVISSIAKLTDVLETNASFIKEESWEKCLYDAEQICGWLLLNTVNHDWWFNNEQKVQPITSKQVIGAYTLDEPAYIEVIISRGFLKAAQYALDKKGQPIPKPWNERKELSLVYDASDKAVDIQLLEPIFKDLHRHATQLPSSVEDIVDAIITRGQANFNKREKLIYYLVTQEYLNEVQQRDWFNKIKEGLAGCFQFICCDKKEQPDQETPCLENQKQVLAQFAELLDMKK